MSDSIYVHGRIADAITREDVDSVRLVIRDKIGAWTSDTLLTHDQVDRAQALALGIPANQIPVVIRYVCAVPHPGAYIVTTHKKGYIDREVEISVPSRQGIRKTKDWTPKDILLQRRTERVLGEAVVQATKVMMVHRGDTVVFNADYFQLSQGSMLDALVEKMPGLEIREGGQIFYQGRKLDNLFVNGREFFKGDPTVALLNLPAYTVKEVKIYNKLSAGQSMMMTQNEKSISAKNPNTLDVILKREYSHGWIANAEAAGGTNSTYLGRLFGLHFDDTSHFGIYGNVNNVNDSQVAGSGGKWSSGWTPANGVTKMVMTGMLFQKDWKAKGLYYSGDFNARREQTSTDEFTFSTTFLDGGDAGTQTFNRQHATQQNRQTHLALDQHLRYENEHKSIYLNAHAATEYIHRRTPSESFSAQFSADPLDAYRGASLDSLYMGPSSPRLASILTNQLAQRSLNRQDSWRQTLDGDLTFRSPLLGNNCSLYYYAYLQQEDASLFNRYDLRYGLAQAGDNQYLNRYTEQLSRSTGTRDYFTYEFNRMFRESVRKWLSVRIDYSFELSAAWSNRGIYKLHQLGEAAEQQEFTLPSTAAWRAQCIDSPNSYRTFSRCISNVISPYLGIGNHMKGLGVLNASLACEFISHFMDRSAMDDASEAAAQTGTARRHYAFFTPHLYWARRFYHERRDGRRTTGDCGLDYRLDFTPADIEYFIPTRDDSDPLALHLTNEQLHAARTHKLKFTSNLEIGKANHRLTLLASFTQQAMAMGYNYNAATGAYTYQPQNVDGNRAFTAQLASSLPFGNSERWNLYAEANYSQVNSVDIVNSERSEVLGQNAAITIKLQYLFGNIGYVALQANPRYDHATSERPGFTARSTWDFNYGPSLNLTPLKDLTLNTNLNVYQRRGYDELSMNDNNLVWNASVSYAFDFRRSSYRSSTKGAEGGTGDRPWSFTLEGFDLLHQLTNTRRVLNAQGITETWTNSLPSYIMLHLTYRWNKQPKKK